MKHQYPFFLQEAIVFKCCFIFMMIYFLNRKKSQQDLEYEETMRTIKKMAHCGMSTMINHSALVLGKADQDNIDLAKYRKKVVAELEDSTNSEQPPLKVSKEQYNRSMEGNK